MSIYTYSVLMAVIEQGSLTRAADQLNLTPSAVSHAIAKLEEEFGFSLFNRSKNRLTLTTEGEQISSLVRNVLVASEMLDHRAAQIRNLTQGIVRIGTISSVATHWLPDILLSYRAQFPNVHFQIVQNGYQRLIQGVSDNCLDMAFVSHAAIKRQNMALQFIPLYKDRMMCVTPQGFRPQNGEFITLDELKKMPLIFSDVGDQIEISNFLMENGIDGQSDFSIFDTMAFVAMVKCGFGYGIMPELALRGYLVDGVKFYPIVPVGYRELGLITMPPKSLNPAAQELVSHIQKFVLEKN